MRPGSAAHRFALTESTIVAALCLIAALMLGAFFLNRPQIGLYPDSSTYLDGARGLLQGHVFSPVRLPGYPAFLLLLGATTGLDGVLLVGQALIYVAAVGLTYYIVRRAFGEKWIAALAGFMMATDLFAASYAKTMLSESLALGIVAALTAAVVSFALEPRVRTVWVMALLATLASLTRPEWSFFGLAAAIYLAALLARSGVPARIAAHGVAALLLSYAAIGGYIAGNAAVNGFVGTTDITNLSLLGKVMTYRMQDEAPASWASTTQLVDSYVDQGKSVWTLVGDHPELARDHYATAGAYARAVILRDPVRYARLSLDLALTRSADFNPQFAAVTRGSTLDRPLRWVEFVASARYFVLYLVPVLSILWLVLAFFRRDSLRAVGVVALVCAYGTAITALGGFDEFGRYHVVFIPASVALTWGTLGLAAQIAIRGFAERRSALAIAATVAILVLLVGAELVPFVAPVRFVLEAALLLVVSGLLWWAWRGAGVSSLAAGSDIAH